MFIFNIVIFKFQLVFYGDMKGIFNIESGFCIQQGMGFGQLKVRVRMLRKYCKCRRRELGVEDMDVGVSIWWDKYWV